MQDARTSARALSTLLLAGLGLCAATLAAADMFIPRLVNSSTVPANGDENPYGVAFVPPGFPAGGKIKTGDVLVSNFNNGNNLQGTGTTIVELNPSGSIAPPGMARTFFASKLVGLSTALGVLRGGFVIVGNVPTKGGTVATIGTGALQVIDRNGNWVQTWTDPKLLDGPWDLTIDDHGNYAHIFVSNVLNGTVTRLDVSVGAAQLKLTAKTTIATGYKHRPNAAALVLGPTGLALDTQHDILYVASTADNAIFAIWQASTRSDPVTRGQEVFSDAHLRGPLALRFAPNGDLLTANGDAVNADVLHPSEIVEFTPWGDFVGEYNVDASQGGAFGLDTATTGPFNYAAIDDVTNSLSVYLLESQ